MTEAFRGGQNPDVTPPSETTPQRRLIVEVGCGLQPFPNPYAAEGRRGLQDNEDYVCIDLFQYQGMTRERMTELFDGYTRVLPGTYRIEQASAEQMPFGDQTVDEVVFVNFWSESVRGVREDIIRETGRVLKDTGTATVVESYLTHPLPVEELRELMEQHGDLVQTNIGDEKNYEGVRMYTDPSRTLRYNPENATEYIATFAKRQIEE